MQMELGPKIQKARRTLRFLALGHNLSKYRERDMTDERLKKRLPKIAIDKAERLNDTKYDR